MRALLSELFEQMVELPSLKAQMNVGRRRRNANEVASRFFCELDAGTRE
jgi:hypothetical protein